MFGRSAAADGEVANRAKNDASKIGSNVFMDFESKKMHKRNYTNPDFDAIHKLTMMPLHPLEALAEFGENFLRAKSPGSGLK